MKKFIQLLSASLVGMSLMAGAGVAGATASCPKGTIQDTGQGSTNIIECTTTTDTHVTCVNGVYVVGENGQAASTGSASGSVSVTGNARNDNNSTVAVGASCGSQVAVAPTTPVTNAPLAGGKGAAPAAPAATPAPAPKVAALPETGSNAVLSDSLIGAAVLGGAIAVSQLGVATYRRISLK